MATHIILTIPLILLSIKSISFINAYAILLQSGNKINGRIIAYEAARHMMILNVTIPKVEFHTEENQSIIAKPIYSWFLEINNYQLHKYAVVYYNKSMPSKFIIKSTIELLINFAIVIGTLVSLMWFTIASS